MFNLDVRTATHNKLSSGRQKRDEKDENLLASTLKKFDVFATESDATVLKNVATKDMLTEKIQSSLLQARKLGQIQLDAFVSERLISNGPDGKPQISYHHPLKKNNAPTFNELYKVKVGSKGSAEKVVKADRGVMQRLIVAYEAGRKVDLGSILKHELLPVPLALAEMNGNIRSGNKAALLDEVTAEVDIPEEIEMARSSSQIIIDGQEMVVSMGRPAKAETFGDLGEVFAKNVMRFSATYERIDVVFDRYKEDSVKHSTRMRRTKTCHPIRRAIENRDVPLPKNWLNFLALGENKADLAKFLSSEMIQHVPPNTEVVLGGGFDNGMEVWSTNHEDDSRLLKS